MNKLDLEIVKDELAEATAKAIGIRARELREHLDVYRRDCEDMIARLERRIEALERKRED